MSTQIMHRPGGLQKSEQQHDYILLDGSSSMQSGWWDSLDAIEAYVRGVRDAHIDSHIILQTFDSQAPDCVQRDIPITQWKSLREEPVGAHWGMTPLYDAINTMCRRLRDLDPPRCSIVIVTDGDENASQYTDLVQAKALLDWCRAKGWQVTFIGAQFDNARQAALLGSSAESAIGVSQKRLTDAAKSLAAKRARYGRTGDDMHFSEDERQQFGGFLGHSK